MNKFLIIRFSSIGDIVLTTPVIRSLKKARPDCEIHYLTKSSFSSLLDANPYVDQIHSMGDSLEEVLKVLQEERFDHILDLHHNLRSLRVKLRLGRPSTSFPKSNLAKALLVHPTLRSFAPPIEHVVLRYGKTLEALNVALDEDGLDFFLPEETEAQAKKELARHLAEAPLAVVLGATYPTKRWIPNHFVTLLNRLPWPVLLLGGADARQEADEILPQLKRPVLDAVGKYPLLMAAALMKQARAVLTHDTGFMHIAAAFKMKVFSLWGNTVPELGMTPYKTESHLLEVKGLSCRPCSKLGRSQCPKGHFKCMKDLSPVKVESEILDAMG